jgi:hypothetical protein
LFFFIYKTKVGPPKFPVFTKKSLLNPNVAAPPPSQGGRPSLNLVLHILCHGMLQLYLGSHFSGE